MGKAMPMSMPTGAKAFASRGIGKPRLLLRSTSDGRVKPSSTPQFWPTEVRQPALDCERLRQEKSAGARPIERPSRYTTPPPCELRRLSVLDELPLQAVIAKGRCWRPPGGVGSREFRLAL